MQTLYLDSQIFRYLKNPQQYSSKEHEIIQLQKAIEDIDAFLIFYSHAHLLDLQRDLSNKKITDIQFMETIVSNNYLIRYFKEKQVQYILKPPHHAFEEVLENHTYSQLNNFSDFDFLKDEDDPSIKSMWRLLMTMWDSIELPGIGDYSSLENISEKDKNTIQQFVPAERTTLLSFMQNFINYSEKFQNDNNVYKNLRALINNAIDKAELLHENQAKEYSYVIDIAKYDLSDEIGKNKIKDAVLKFVRNTLKNSNDTPSQFDIHYQAYFSLDLLGIQKEKSRKLKTQNLLNDAQHSYYAGCCQIVVSDDFMFREKTKFLFELFKIDSKVFSISEFISYSHWLQNEKIKTVKDFWNRLAIDLKYALVSKSFNTFDQNVTVFKLKTLYFDYFNEIRTVIYQEDEYIFLKHIQKTYLTSSPYKTMKAVVDKMWKVFGLDDLGFSEFNFAVETEEINAKKWRGRNWNISQAEIKLFYNYESNLLQIQIYLK